MTAPAVAALCECGCGSPLSVRIGVGRPARFVDAAHRQRAHRRGAVVVELPAVTRGQLFAELGRRRDAGDQDLAELWARIRDAPPC